MANLLMPPSVRDLRGQAIEALANRVAQLDLSPLLVYRVESVPAAALVFLAWQFDVLSPLWQLVAPFDPAGVGDSAIPQRRALIENAIALHKLRGTPASIKQALAAIGLPNATILEGQNSWGGDSYPSDEGWAVCRVLINLQNIVIDPATVPPWEMDGEYQIGAVVSYLGLLLYANGLPTPGVAPAYADVASVPDFAQLSDVANLIIEPWLLAFPWESGQPISAALATEVIEVFNFFKPARCLLDSVWFVEPGVTDSAPTPTDQLNITGIAEIGSDAAPRPTEGALTMDVTMPALTEDYPAIAPLYNAHYHHHGITYGASEPLVADGPLLINGVVDGTS